MQGNDTDVQFIISRMSGKRKPVDYARVYAQRKARYASRGLTPYQVEKIRKTRGSSIIGPVPQERAMLAEFGVTPRQFEKMRVQNREYGFNAEKWMKRSPKHIEARVALDNAMLANNYQYKLDRPNDWSRERVGYVVTFNKAIIDPKTNYSSLLDSDGDRIRGKRNSWQADYMGKYRWVQYDPDNDELYINPDDIELETRYGAVTH